MLLLANEYDSETTVCLEQAALLDPQEFRWPYLLGVHLAVSAPKDAAQRFRQALELRPGAMIAHLRLGELLLDQRQFEDSARHLRQALEIDQRSPRAACAMARLEVLTGKPQAALQWAETAARIAPDRRATRETLGMVYQRLNRREEALRELTIAEQLASETLGWEDPYVGEVLTMRHQASEKVPYAESLIAEGRVAEAIQSLESSIHEDRRDPKLFCVLARAHIKQNQLERASEVLRQAEQEHPRSAEVQFQQGVVRFLMDDLERAVLYFRKAIELKPDYALAHYNLGHGLTKLGDNRGAISAFAASVQLRPDYAPARVNLGKALIADGDVAAARVQLRVAVELAPQDKEARELLRKVSP